MRVGFSCVSVTQYTAVVCFGNLKLETSLVPGSGAIVILLLEKTSFLVKEDYEHFKIVGLTSYR